MIFFNFKVDAIKKEANDLEQGYGGDKKQEINDIKVGLISKSGQNEKSSQSL